MTGSDAKPAPAAPKAAADSASPAPASPVAANPGPPPPRLLAWAARHAPPVLALLAVLIWLPGIVLLPPLDRDESRFAQSSRQMVESGDIVDIRFGQVPRYKKPVGIYWLQAAATELAGFGDRSHIWTYRLPSFLGGVVAVWLTAWIGGLFSAESGLLAGRLLLASLLLTVEASMATTDAVLLAAIMGMQGVLLRLYRAAREDAPLPSNRMILAGWAALAIGILVKGPVAPGVALATILALYVWETPWKDKAWAKPLLWLKQTRPLQGLGLTLLIVAPWLIAIALESHGAFFQQSLGNDFAAKLANGQEGHGAPPGYYLLLSTVIFWPAVLFILPGIGTGFDRRNEPMIRFLIAWAGAWWLVVEAVPTKLPNYVLPALPPLMILAALWLTGPRERSQGWRSILPWVAAVQFLIGLAAMVVGPVFLTRSYALGVPGDLLDNWPLLSAVCLTLVLGLVALTLFLTGLRLSSAVTAFAAAAIAILTLTVWVGPNLNQLWISERLAALVAKDRTANDPPPMLAGYQEPSLVFDLGWDVDLTDGKGAAEHGAKTGGLALIDDQERSAFLARLAELEATASIADELSGFNYSRGKPTHITVYRVAPLNQNGTPHVQ